MTTKTSEDSTTPAATDAVRGAGDRRTQAFKVLVGAVEALASRLSRWPTASEVRLEIKRQTYGGFDSSGLGYKRFRDFLVDASDRGYIEVDTERSGDFAISVPIGRQDAAEAERPVRPDLWKAFVDWTPDLLRFYDLQNDQAVMIPEKPAPFEPERFRVFRDRLKSEPEAFVPIKVIAVHEQLTWMKRFAADVSDPGLRKLLDAAFENEKPVKSFLTVLRAAAPDQLQRWYGVLRQEVRRVIEQW